MGDDGLLGIYFVASVDQATVAGIEIMPPAVLRIDAGSTSPFSDNLVPSPRTWEADSYFTGKGFAYQAAHTVAARSSRHREHATGCANRCFRQQQPFTDASTAGTCICIASSYLTGKEAACHNAELSQCLPDAGSGSQSVPGHISNAADGSAGLYNTWHIAQQFTYMLGASNGLVASSDYVAVLHFSGKPLAVHVLTFCRSIAYIYAKQRDTAGHVADCPDAAWPIIVPR